MRGARLSTASISFDEVYTISNRYRVTLYVTICLTAIGTSDGYGTIGSAMEDLRINLKVKTGSIATVATVFIYLYTIGCVCAYFTLDKFNRQAQFCIALVLFAISQYLIPLCKSLEQLVFVLMLGGFSNAYTDSISMAWVVELFRHQTQVFLLICFFFVSVGQFLSQVVSAPFLTTLDSSSPDFDLNTAEPNYRIKYPFIILGSWVLSCAVLQIISFCFKRYTGPKRNANTYPFPEEQMNLICYPISRERKELYSKGELGNHLTPRQRAMYTSDNIQLKTYYWVFIFLASIEGSLIMFIQGNVSVYLPVFIHHHLHLTMPDATWYSSISSITTCVVLFFFIFLSFKVNHNFLMYINLIFLVAGHLVMLYFSHISKLWLATSVVFMGFGASSCYPLLLAFIEKKVTVSNSVSALTFFSCAILISFNPILFGSKFEENPLFFMWVNLFCVIAAIIVFISLNAMDFWYKHIYAKFEHIPNQ